MLLQAAFPQAGPHSDAPDSAGSAAMMASNARNIAGWAKEAGRPAIARLARCLDADLEATADAAGPGHAHARRLRVWCMVIIAAMMCKQVWYASQRELLPTILARMLALAVMQLPYILYLAKPQLQSSLRLRLRGLTPRTLGAFTMAARLFVTSFVTAGLLPHPLSSATSTGRGQTQKLAMVLVELVVAGMEPFNARVAAALLLLVCLPLMVILHKDSVLQQLVPVGCNLAVHAITGMLARLPTRVPAPPQAKDVRLQPPLQQSEPAAAAAAAAALGSSHGTRAVSQANRRVAVVVSRPEDGGGRLAMKIMEPMLSLIKRHTLHTCTLDRDTNAELPVLTMVLLTKATVPTASSPPQSSASRPAAAPKQAPSSVPAPASAPAPVTGVAVAQHKRGGSSQHKPHKDLLQTGAPGESDDQLEARQVSQVGGVRPLEELDGQGAAGSLSFPATAQQLATMFWGARLELPMLLLLRCHIDGVLQPYEQRASLRSQGHVTALWLKDPMLSLMRGRRTLSWSLAPAQGGTGSLPEMTQPMMRVTGSGDHTASESSDGSDSGDDEQAPGRRGRKRSVIAAATNAAAAAVETPPAKKGRSQAPSGAAKVAQKRKATGEQPVAAATSSFRGVSLNRKSWEAVLWDRDTSSKIYLGVFDSEEEAARVFDRASIVFKGAEAKTNFPVTDYAQELPQLKKMTRKEVIAHERRASNGSAEARPATVVGAGTGSVRQTSGRWETQVKTGSRMTYLGTHSTDEDAARMFDFAVLSLRGVDTQTVTNFGKGAYIGANGALLPVEAALPGLGHDKHKLVRDKLAVAMAGAGGTAEGGGQGVSDGGSESDSNSGSGSAGLASPARSTGHAALDAQLPARRRGPASGGGKAGGHGKAPGARQASRAPRLPLPPPPQQQQQAMTPHPLAHAPQQGHQLLCAAPLAQQAQQAQLAAPQAPAAGPAVRDYRARSAALAFLRELKVALDEGVLPLHVYQQQHAQAMADLGEP
ncbi:hypothetical protein FOA52_007404 [Chlamydomonas sp. UWO 241]|nr:hypothetical protein FOA52_007404 [Chlamydomonas sp. UWO 241]